MGLGRFIADYGRLFRVAVALARHDVVLPAVYRDRLPLPARLFGKGLRGVSGGAKGRPGERLARALEALGPTYIKLGQLLATRPDVFGVETTSDLDRLKDDLPATDEATARRQLEDAFPDGLDKELFPDLGEAIAAASLAQVHRVETPNGPLAVKILRPGIERRVLRELRAMRRGANLVERVDRESRRLKPVALVDTLAASMEKELDLRLEAGAVSEFGEMARETGLFAVPTMDWDRSRKRVLTTDWIDGVRLTDAAAVAGLPNRIEVANAITAGFLETAIGKGVFHADIHEGNLIVRSDGTLTLLDFGIVGRIGLTERRYLAEILYGFIRRDYMRIAEVHFEAGYVPPEKSVGDFAQALRSVGEPIHGKPADEMSMGDLLLQLFDFTHLFGMQLRPELVLLQKTMVQVEGVARRLDPTHSVWVAAEPVVSKWVRSELGPEGVLKQTAAAARQGLLRLQTLPQLYDRLDAALETLARPEPPDHAPGLGWPAAFAVSVSVLGVGATVIALAALLGN